MESFPSYNYRALWLPIRRRGDHHRRVKVIAGWLQLMIAILYPHFIITNPQRHASPIDWRVSLRWLNNSQVELLLLHVGTSQLVYLSVNQLQRVKLRVQIKSSLLISNGRRRPPTAPNLVLSLPCPMAKSKADHDDDNKMVYRGSVQYVVCCFFSNRQPTIYHH